jgi:hypothetical protein
MGQSPGTAESRVKGIVDQPQSHQEENKRGGKGEEVVTAGGQEERRGQPAEGKKVLEGDLPGPDIDQVTPLYGAESRVVQVTLPRRAARNEGCP